MRADKEKVMPLLKTARGQLDAVIRMAEEDRYCVDISNQLLAIRALVNKANKLVLEAHLKGCVADDIQQGSGEKIEEILVLLDKML